jgi:hypothetical protein
MRINDAIVILFSGAEKTAPQAQDCPNVRPHFLLANRLSKAIQEAILEKDIIIDEEKGELIIDADYQLEL